MSDAEEIRLICIECGDYWDSVDSIDEVKFPDNVEDRGNGPEVEQGVCDFCSGFDQP